MSRLHWFLLFIVVVNVFARPCVSEYVPVDYLSTANMAFVDDRWILDGQEGLVETAVAVSPLDHLTGFAFRIEGEMALDQALNSEIYWSYDGENWEGPITDDEVEITNPDKEPYSHYIFSDFYYPDDPPAKYYKVILHVEERDMARLGTLEMVFIDCGRTENPPQPVMSTCETTDLCPMPSYINRAGWGCTQVWSPSYRNAWIWAIHHTAGATSTPSDPASVIYSIWYYHTAVNGWSDIGYQFLLDHLGNIYQGRYNADLTSLDVVGAHVGGHNTGCVGLSVLGNFETAYVASATLNAIYDLVSWKCEQRSIDPYGSSWLVDGTFPNISGHRDIGSTACPGAHFYPLLPSIRDTVANRLAGSSPEPPSGDTMIVDNGDPGYSTSGGWVDGTYSVSNGYLNDYQFCNAGGTIDRAIFTPTLPEDGTYAVYMWWYGGTNRCDGITVKISGSSTDYVTVSQRDSGSSWHSLGDYLFSAGTSGYVSISDSTYSGDGCSVVIADAVMWIMRYGLSTEELKPEDLNISVYPNPFNSACRIEGPAGAEYTVTDVQGRILQSGTLDNGSAVWTPSEDAPSGTYLLQINTGISVMMSRLTYVK